MSLKITVLPGDGVGPEVTQPAVQVLQAIAEGFGHEFEFSEALIGGAAIDACGDSLPQATARACLEADAVLLGAVGGPRWSDPDAAVRPEDGLLGLRKAMSVFANLRPVRPDPNLVGFSPLRPEKLNRVDMIVVRELTGGIYFGEKTRTAHSASDLCLYTVPEIERVIRVAADLAMRRNGRLTSVDKANVLESSRLWRSTTTRVITEEYPDLELEHLLVDAAAMHLLSRPADFDVLVTENMFGDILTDEASMLTGSMGMLPSASLGEGGPGLYEPIHGSAPDIAGKGIANPLGAILSAAMLLRHSAGLETEAAAVESAVAGTVAAGILTPDLSTRGAGASTTRQVADSVSERVRETGKRLAAAC